jgi:HSP20 family protein
MNLSLWKKRPSALSPSSLNGDFARLRNEMDQVFDRFFTDPFAFAAIEPKMLRAEGWAPAIDVSENDTEVIVRAEVPGIAAKDLDISVSGNVLTIAGQKEEKCEAKDEGYCSCERRFGSFRRSFDLPDTVDADKINAESDNGVVTIHIPKKPGVKPKQIEVKAAAKKVPLAG